MTESRPSDPSESPAVKATLQRLLNEAQVRIADLEAELAGKSQDTARLQQELDERMQAYRKLQRRADQDRAELVEQKDQITRVSADLKGAQTKLADAEAARGQVHARLIRTESELKELRRAVRETQAEAPKLPEPAPADQPPPPAAVDPGALVPQTADDAYAAFCDLLCEYSRLQRAEAPPHSPELSKRLGHAAAVMVVFEETVERGVLAILEELGTRQPVLHEHLNVLQYLRGGDRPWWRTVAESAGRQRSGDRRFGMYLTQVAKMNFALLTAYHRTLAETVAERARQLLNPVEMRKKSGRTRAEDLWNYYEDTASSGIPPLLGDTCRAELAKTIDQLYRFGADAH